MKQSVLLFCRANIRHLAELFVAGALVNLIGLGLPLFSMLVYDKIIGNEIHDTLWALCTGMALLLGIEACLRLSRVMLIEHAGARWDAALDERLMRSVLATPISRKLTIGATLARYREVAGAREVMSSSLLLPLVDLPFALLFGVALYVVGGSMALVPVAIGLVLVLVSTVFTAAARSRQQRANAATARKTTLLADTLIARESLGTNGAARRALAGFRTPSVESSRTAARARLWSSFAQQSMGIGMTASAVVTLVGGVMMVESQSLSVGGLMSCVQLSSRLLGLLCGLVPILGRWKDFTSAFQSLGEAVDLSIGQSASVETFDMASFNGQQALTLEGIRLQGVTVHFPQQERLILDHINLHLQPGRLVALVGASGSGKSTLLRLLAGRLAHTQGQMACAGHVINDDLQRRRLAASVSYKPQEPCFLGGTLAEILAPGDSDVDEARLIAALRDAGLGPALDRGEIGLSTEVGTNGEGLSGGQRQMLAIARALYENSPIVLLDEPTLGLDRTAQDTVIAAMLRQKDHRCLIIATHTTELIQTADRVLVLDHGRLVADATPERLLQPTKSAPSPAPASAASTSGAPVPAASVPPVTGAGTGTGTGDATQTTNHHTSAERDDVALA